MIFFIKPKLSTFIFSYFVLIKFEYSAIQSIGIIIFFPIIIWIVAGLFHMDLCPAYLIHQRISRFIAFIILSAKLLIIEVSQFGRFKTLKFFACWQSLAVFRDGFLVIDRRAGYLYCCKCSLSQILKCCQTIFIRQSSLVDNIICHVSSQRYAFIFSSVIAKTI